MDSHNPATRAPQLRAEYSARAKKDVVDRDFLDACLPRPASYDDGYALIRPAEHTDVRVVFPHSRIRDAKSLRLVRRIAAGAVFPLEADEGDDRLHGFTRARARGEAVIVKARLEVDALELLVRRSGVDVVAQAHRPRSDAVARIERRPRRAPCAIREPRRPTPIR